MRIFVLLILSDQLQNQIYKMDNNQNWTDFFSRFYQLLLFLNYVKQQQEQHCNLEGGGRKEGKGSWQEHINTCFQQLTVQSLRRSKHPIKPLHSKNTDNTHLTAQNCRHCHRVAKRINSISNVTVPSFLEVHNALSHFQRNKPTWA